MTIVSSGQTLIVSGGQTSSGDVVLNGGTEAVLSGGTVISSVISTGGRQVVSSGGVASATTLIFSQTVMAGGSALATALARFSPDIVFYLAGADPYAGDRLGRLALTVDGLGARDRRVFAMAASRGLPVVVAMAGGYGRVIEETCAIHAQTVAIAAAYADAWATRPRDDDAVRYLRAAAADANEPSDASGR